MLEPVIDFEKLPINDPVRVVWEQMNEIKHNSNLSSDQHIKVPIPERQKSKILAE